MSQIPSSSTSTTAQNPASDANNQAVHVTPNLQPQIVVGLQDSAVEYSDSSGWNQLQGTGWSSAIPCSSVQWSVVTPTGSSNP